MSGKQNLPRKSSTLARKFLYFIAICIVLVLGAGLGLAACMLVQCVLDLLDRSGRGPALLASPTGRAAKRLQESTGRKASTLHRLLGFDPHAMTFRRGSNDPLKADFLVVDEASMLDLSLAHSLFAAIPPGCGVLLVGDSDQLPSVGAGTRVSDVCPDECSGRSGCAPTALDASFLGVTGDEEAY